MQITLVMLRGEKFIITKNNMSIEQSVAQALIKREAVKVSIAPPFTWASGIKSPVYCDNRKMLGFVEERDIIVDGFLEKIADLDFDVVAGTATAGIPWASFIAQKLNKPMVYIRSAKKDHGAGKQIEGFLAPNQKVLVVEDLISTGGSSIKAVEAVREEGNCIVNDVVAIVTWEIPKSVERFSEAGLNLVTLTNYTNIIGLASETGAIPEDKLSIVLEFKQDPAGWGEKMGF